MFFLFIFLEIVSSAAPPALTVAGDENPPGYPVIRAHLEIPAMPIRDFHVGRDLKAYEQGVVSWSISIAKNLKQNSKIISALMDTLLKREQLRFPSSFVQGGIPGLDMFEALGKSFGSGFSDGPPAQNNTGPSPIINIMVEKVSRKNITRAQVTNSTILQRILDAERRELLLWETLRSEPWIPAFSLVQLPVNYVESNALPNTHIEVSLESVPIGEGEIIPSLTLPRPIDIQLGVMQAKAKAMDAALRAQLTALGLAFKAAKKMR